MTDDRATGSFVRNSYGSTLCPVVICPYLCTSDTCSCQGSIEGRVCVCVYMYVYIYIYIYIHTHMYSYRHVCYIYIYIYRERDTHTCYIYIYVYVYIYIYTYVYQRQRQRNWQRRRRQYRQQRCGPSAESLCVVAFVVQVGRFPSDCLFFHGVDPKRKGISLECSQPASCESARREPPSRSLDIQRIHV